MLNKLILGTVQFGLNYGINNCTGKISQNGIDSILNTAILNGIKYIDTSFAYGDSESALGNAFMKNETLNFDIISKYPKSDQTIECTLKQSLANLKQSSLYGYLIHHFDTYQSNPSIWEDMQHLKELRLVKKIGFSLYSPSQLCHLLDNNVSFELLQLPYNIFDRQFEPYFSLLKNQGVEIHTRSVFLQGLLFKEPSQLQGKLRSFIPYLKKLRGYCNSKQLPMEKIALNYVSSNNFIDGVLIGIDNCEQLQANIEALDCDFNMDIRDFINSIIVRETELLNPVNW